jgi:hypothetical protein
VNESLSKLEQLDARQGRIVELCYFGGYHRGDSWSHGHLQ